jgi:hypothetical protein
MKIPGTNYFLDGEATPRAIMRLEGLGNLKKKKFTLSETGTGDLPGRSIVPQPATLPGVPTMCGYRSVKDVESWFQYQKAVPLIM